MSSAYTRPLPTGQTEYVWQKESKIARRKLNMSPTMRPWTGRPEVELRGIHRTERELDILDLYWAKACRQRGCELSDASVAKGLFVDISKSYSRLSVCIDRICTNLTTSRKYSYERDRCLVAADMLGLMGFDRHMLDFATEEQAKSMVGEAVAAPHMAGALYPLLGVLHAPALFSDV